MTTTADASSDFTVRPETLEKVRQLLAIREVDGERRGLYDADQWALIEPAIRELGRWLSEHKPANVLAADRDARRGIRLTAATTMAWCYLDHFVPVAGESRAATVVKFFNRHLADGISLLHILPHFECPAIHPELPGPARRADGGFEPMSFDMDPHYGKPEDLRDLRATMMFDAVINHMSAKGPWFRRYLEDEPGYERFFVTVPPDLDWSQVTRPRVHDPIVPFTSSSGKTKHVWCTFSLTQADLDVREPRVFVAILDALVKQFLGAGATWIRLDAVGYLVKFFGLTKGEPRTSSFHMPETHAVVKAIRAIFDDICPSATLVAEINDTKENINTYYGDGDEAHLTYAFPCPPLSLVAMYAGDARLMLDWARELTPERPALVFVNSHDGVGLVPLDSFDEPETKARLISELERRGAAVNFKSKRDAAGNPIQVPYEVCITLLQAVLDPSERSRIVDGASNDEEIARIVDRFIATQSFMYSLPHAVPSDYFGSLVGLLNDETTHAATKHHRDKNRGLIDLAAFESALSTPKSAYERLVARLFTRKKELLLARRSTEAFSPMGRCEIDVLEGQSGKARPVATFLRHSPDGHESVLAVTNISAEPQHVTVCCTGIEGSARDLLGGTPATFTRGRAELSLTPYRVAWFVVRSKGALA